MDTETTNQKSNFPHIADVSHSFITINGTKMHVAQAGKGRPLLLLHGWPQHWYEWRKIIPLLKNNYRLIMPDFPGFGWSEMPEDKDFRKEKLAKDIIKLIETLELKQVDLVGHAWGAWIGFLACMERPELFHKFVALGMLHPSSVTPLPINQYHRFFYQIPVAMPLLGVTLFRFFPSLTRWMIKHVAWKKDSWTEEELSWFSSQLQIPHQAKASSLLYRDFITKELIPAFRGKYRKKKFQTQTLILLGEDDPVIHTSLFEGFSHETVRIKTIKDSGHFIAEEQPEAVAKEIKTFFE